MTTLEPEEPAPGEPTASALDPADAVLEEVAAEVDALEAVVDLTPLDRSRRLLLVHAHPDDEAIGTGATMAKYASEGVLVALVTCTRGEEGEVVVPELAHLAPDRDDTLGELADAVLAAACEALGVSEHRYLGGPGRWRDSGMMGVASNDRPGCFWRADVDEAVGELVAVVRELRPQVVVTYDSDGGYGHPDHIQAHRVTLAAVEAAGDPAYRPGAGEPWQVAKVYATAVPKSWLQQAIDTFRASGTPFLDPGVTSAEDLPIGVPDELVTTEVDARDHLEAKVAAMRAHRTQISVDGPFFALADGVGQRAFGVEHYVLLRGDRGPGDGPDGRETDLFAGLDEGGRPA